MLTVENSPQLLPPEYGTVDYRPPIPHAVSEPEYELLPGVSVLRVLAVPICRLADPELDDEA